MPSEPRMKPAPRSGRTAPLGISPSLGDRAGRVQVDSFASDALNNERADSFGVHPLASAPVIIPFHFHEWDRLVSGVGSYHNPDIGPVLVEGLGVGDGRSWDPSGNHLAVTTLGSGSGEAANPHG